MSILPQLERDLVTVGNERAQTRRPAIGGPRTDSATARPRRRRRMWGLSLGAAALALAGGAVAVAGLTPEREATRDASAASIELLHKSPRLDLSQLPGNQSSLLTALAVSQGATVVEHGWRLGDSDPTAVAVFELSNGRFCFVADGQGSCTNRDEVSPNVGHRYIARDDRTVLTIIAPAGVSDFSAHASSGASTPVQITAGLTEASVPGRVDQVSWQTNAIPVTRVFRQ